MRAVAPAGLMLTRARRPGYARAPTCARARLGRALPDLAAIRARIATLRTRPPRASRRTTARRMPAVAHVDGRLRALSPLATLERGYALVERADGVAVTLGGEPAARATRVELRLRDGARAPHASRRGA